MSFGTLGTSPVTIVDSGDLNSSQGFIPLDDADVQGKSQNFASILSNGGITSQ